jgi:hypothetical protein
MVWRKISLWLGAAAGTIVLIVLSTTAALWLSVGGTFFRGERVTAGTVFQIAVLILSCVGLGYLVWVLMRAALKK